MGGHAVAEAVHDVFLEIISLPGRPSILQSPPAFLYNADVWDPVVELLERVRNQRAVGVYTGIPPLREPAVAHETLHQ